MQFAHVHHNRKYTREQNPFVHGRSKTPNASFQAVESYSSRPGQAQSRTLEPTFGKKFVVALLSIFSRQRIFTKVSHRNRTWFWLFYFGVVQLVPRKRSFQN